MLTVLIVLLVVFLVLTVLLALRQKKSNEQLEQQNKEITANLAIIKEKDSQTENILSVVAHDISSPLRSVLGLIDLLKEEQLKTNDSEELIALIEASAKNGIEISNSLLNATKVAEYDHDDEKLCDVSEAIEHVIKVNLPSAHHKDITIDRELEPEVFSKIHLPSFCRLVDNILSNAVKYSPKKGRVKVQFNKQDGRAHLRVIDSGPGFSASDLEKAYRPFQKLSAKPTGNESSNGLGLFITRSIANALGAQLRIEGREDASGSIFHVILPLKAT